jgi:hypothetical protein
MRHERADTRARFRTGAFRASALLCALLIVVVAAAGTSIADEPHPRTLWKAYPLDPHHPSGATSAPSATTGPRATPRQIPGSQQAVVRTESHLLEMIALGLAGFLTASLIAWRVSRRPAYVQAPARRIGRAAADGVADSFDPAAMAGVAVAGEAARELRFVQPMPDGATDAEPEYWVLKYGHGEAQQDDVATSPAAVNGRRRWASRPTPSTTGVAPSGASSPDPRDSEADGPPMPRLLASPSGVENGQAAASRGSGPPQPSVNGRRNRPHHDAADRQRRREAAEKREAEEKRRREAEEKQRREAEVKQRREAEENRRREAEEKRRREAEEKRRREAEEKQRREAEVKQRREAEENRRREAEEKQRREAEEKQRHEAEEKLRREAEEKQRHEAEERQRREAEERQRHEAEEKRRREAEEKRRRQAEEEQRRETERRRRETDEQQRGREAEERRGRIVEERSRRKAAVLRRRETSGALSNLPTPSPPDPEPDRSHTNDRRAQNAAPSGARRQQAVRKDAASASPGPAPPRPAPPGKQTSRRPVQQCAIVCDRSGPTAEFHLVPLDESGNGPPVTRSQSFAVSPSGAIADRGEARAAHDTLVSRLSAAGWRLEAHGTDWYEAVFTRDAPDELARRVDQCVVACRRHAREARFEALQLDDYGNATRLAASPAFGVRRLGSVRPTDEARAMHTALVGYLQRLGWEIQETSADEWFATALQRSRT